LARRKILSGLGLEDHYAARQPKLGRTLTKTRQDCLVASVNAVKIANSGDATPMPGPQVMKTSNQLHTALLD